MQVTVLMSTYNAEKYIAETIESILNQTYKDFELLISEDGSTDNTLNIIKQYSEKDARIKIFAHENMGIALSFNQAIKLIENEWIVRMDADDIMMPNRMERQVAFIQENPDIAVASSFVYNIDENGKIIAKYESPLTNREIVADRVKRNHAIGFHHPAVIMRKSVVQEVGGYRQEFFPTEDLDLWNRIAERGYTILVQPEYLLKYRIHGTSTSISRAKTQAQKIRWIEECIVKRRNGYPEPTWQEFLDSQKRKPWWDRLNQERLDMGFSYYKSAVSYYSKRQLHLLFLTLIIAALLRPVYVFGQVTSKLKGVSNIADK